MRDSIGVVPQELTADDELKGIENIMLAANLHHVSGSEARKRSQELLRLVDLEAAADRKVKTYSGGMRRRLQLAMGLVHMPKVLFLDEPTLGLDIQTRKKMWDYIGQLNRERGLTVFMTTHYLEEADSLCKRIAIVDKGVIKVSGSPAELKQKLGGDILTLELSEGAADLTDFFKGIPGRLRGHQDRPGIPDKAPQDGEGAPGHRGRGAEEEHADQGDILHQANARPGLPRGHWQVDARRGRLRERLGHAELHDGESEVSRMINETLVLSARALKKWIRNPAAVVPGLVTSIFYIALFGSSFNPANLIPSGDRRQSILQDRSAAHRPTSPT